MKAIYSDKHRIHAPKQELHKGIVGPPFEVPGRADIILRELRARKAFELLPPETFSFEYIEKVHDPGYLQLLQTAWQEWHRLGREGDALPANWAAGHMRTGPPPENLDGRLGYYSFSGDSSITAGTWEAALASAFCALTGMKHLLKGEAGMFSLCRPPGHHASFDLFGGYCYLNNAAIAAEYALSRGVRKAAILDLDYHHGNGTQDIFYRRKDVLFLSIHADPMHVFPYFTGFADQEGAGEGSGYTRNYPLLPGSSRKLWFSALDDALGRIGGYTPEVLIVSLGVDTYRNDPLSTFLLESEDFQEVGRRICRVGLPVLFVMEGGYAVEDIGFNVCNCLEGYSCAGG